METNADFSKERRKSNGKMKRHEIVNAFSETILPHWAQLQ